MILLKLLARVRLHQKKINQSQQVATVILHWITVSPQLPTKQINLITVVIVVILPTVTIIEFLVRV